MEACQSTPVKSAKPSKYAAVDTIQSTKFTRLPFKKGKLSSKAILV